MKEEGRKDEHDVEKEDTNNGEHNLEGGERC